MRLRSFVAGAGVAALLVAGTPGVAAAADGVVPPGCSTERYEDRDRYVTVAVGTCDSTVTRPWRLVMRVICGFGGSSWPRTPYSLESPKEFEMPLFCLTFPPSIELQP